MRNEIELRLNVAYLIYARSWQMVLGENLIYQLPQSPLGREIHEALMAEPFESHTATLCQRMLAGADRNERVLCIRDDLDSGPSLFPSECLKAQIHIP